MHKNFLLAALWVVVGCKAPVDDEAAIKAVLERESATWRAGDVAGHAACWHLQPYSRILVSLPNGKTIDVPPQAIINPTPADMDLGSKAVNSNYKIGINGNTAVVSHDETSTAPDGKKSLSYELRVLEKIKGEWKLVAQSIHVYE